MDAKSNKFATLFNEKKLKILFAIYRCSENVCACDISEGLDLSKNLLSYHIRTLREAGLIEEVRCGRFKNYRIKKNKLQQIEQIFKINGML